jgi:Zn finger protein HypA/HybF involved in hydrogenase expression
MSPGSPAGLVYRCSVCGAEVIAVGERMGEFTPRCCNQPMRLMTQRAIFYHCPVCGSEIVIVRKGRGLFDPRCCNVPMVLKAA